MLELQLELAQTRAYTEITNCITHVGAYSTHTGSHCAQQLRPLSSLISTSCTVGHVDLSHPHPHPPLPVFHQF